MSPGRCAIAMVAVFIATLAFGSFHALADDARPLPLRWDLDASSSAWIIEFEALEELTDVRVEIDLISDGRREPLVRALREQLHLDEPTEERFSPPVRAGRVEMTFRGTWEGTERTMTEHFEYAPDISLRMRLLSEAWDPRSPSLSVETWGASQVRLIVRDEDNEIVHSHEREVDPSQTVTSRFSWDEPSSPTLFIEVRAEAPDGAHAWERLIPWEVQVDIESILFPTGSAEIPSEEEAKLRPALDEIRETVARVSQWVDVQLYIGGYTDTVGSVEANRRLSQARAASIGAWFRRNGVSIPILAQGFGQEVLEVPTPDQTDEPRNRRAVLLLTTGEPSGPNFPRSDWVRVR